MAGYKYPDLVPDMELASVLDAAAITPDDNNDLAYATRSLWVGGAGNVTVMLAKASAPVTYYNVPAGTRRRHRPLEAAEILTCRQICRFGVRRTGKAARGMAPVSWLPLCGEWCMDSRESTKRWECHNAPSSVSGNGRRGGRKSLRRRSAVARSRATPSPTRRWG